MAHQRRSPVISGYAPGMRRVQKITPAACQTQWVVEIIDFSMALVFHSEVENIDFSLVFLGCFNDLGGWEVENIDFSLVCASRYAPQGLRQIKKGQ